MRGRGLGSGVEGGEVEGGKNGCEVEGGEEGRREEGEGEKGGRERDAVSWALWSEEAR